MRKCEEGASLLGSGSCVVSAIIVLMMSSGIASANELNRVQAIPDYGSNDCVSFKHSADTNPLNFTFGYACVSESYCEVSAHGCIDEYCHHTDYSRGARTTLTNIAMASRVDEISMGATGQDLASNAQWCLVQDGAGNFWALDKHRGHSESFNLHNLGETVVPCKTTDYFHTDSGCTADAGLQ